MIDLIIPFAVGFLNTETMAVYQVIDFVFVFIN